MHITLSVKTRALGGVYKSSQHIASKTNINQPIKMNDNPEKECSMDFYGGGVDDEDHFIKNINNRNANNITVDKVRWVLTVPAIWNDPAKQLMREAAEMVS